jgi:hypothetical protein
VGWIHSAKVEASAYETIWHNETAMTSQPKFGNNFAEDQNSGSMTALTARRQAPRNWSTSANPQSTRQHPLSAV